MLAKILKFALIVWIILWIWFIAREIFIKGGLAAYKELLSRSFDGRHSYVTGDRLYDFIKFCKKEIPQDATYGIKSREIVADTLSGRQLIYYLYPRMIRNDPLFILMYDSDEPKVSGYSIIAKLDDKRYILRKA